MRDLELLDCGDGRRLERFGDVIVDRPAPAAVMPARLPPADWRRARLRWGPGGWTRGAGREPWAVRAGGLTLECRPAAGGQVGVFAEHAGTWGWLDGAVRAAGARLERPPEILSLFAYTGGATLACASGRRAASPTWMPRGPPSAGPAGTPSSPASPTVRSGGWSTTPGRSSGGSGVAVGATTGSCSIRPATATGTGRGGSTTTSPASSTTSPRCSALVRRCALLSAHTPGYDGERLAALLREHLGVAATGAELRLTATSGNVLRLGAWAWASADRAVGTRSAKMTGCPIPS